ncbi:MAG: hypothetical protein ABDK87_02945 [Atribacterota bacterium]
MELCEDKPYWENRLKECMSFMEKVRVLEELLLFLEERLSKVLGEGETEDRISEENDEKSDRNLFESFVEALEALRKQEENRLKAPQVRKRMFKEWSLWNLKDLSLQDLLELYARYLGKDRDGGVTLPDKGFEQLLEKRRRVILSLCSGDGLVPLRRFFEDCAEKRAIIATFLVLLDLVFRNILYLKREESGDIFLGGAGSKVSSEPS